MKIICSKSHLLKAVNTVSKAVPTRTTMEILQCILIDASADVIKITANDMELGIETIIPGKIVERGMIALDARFFSEIVRKLPDNEVTIQVGDSYKTLITCEKSKFNIVGKSGEDFSYLPYVEKNDPLVISEFTLKDVIRQTIFSIADNDNNKLMTGELFEIKDNNLRVVSLDGHRISIRNIALKENCADRKVVIPGKTLQEISKILAGEAEDMVMIYFTNNHVLFEFQDTKVVSRLIEGEYFHIDQMLSTDYETKVVINKKELLDCIDRASLMIREGDKKPIILNITDDKMDLRIRSLVGTMDESLEIEKNGKDLMIGFNPKFFMDSLRVIDEETVNLYLMNAKAPCYIKDEDETFIYMILPVNFK